MKSSTVSQGHKKLILVVSLAMGYAAVLFATMIYGKALEAMTPILVRFFVTICVAYFLFIGKVWAKTLFNIYLLLIAITNIMIIVMSVSYGWNVKSTIAVFVVILHGYCLYQMMRSKDIADYLKVKSGEVA